MGPGGDRQPICALTTRVEDADAFWEYISERVKRPGGGNVARANRRRTRTPPNLRALLEPPHLHCGHEALVDGIVA